MKNKKIMAIFLLTIFSMYFLNFNVMALKNDNLDLKSKNIIYESYISSLQSKKNISNEKEIFNYISKLNYNQSLDYDQELKRISEEYKVGEILNENDTKILFESMLYNPENIMEKRSGSLSKSIPSKTLTKFNTKVTLSGTMYQNIANGAGTNTYRGAIKVIRNSGKSSQVKMSTYHTAYGGAGWNGNFPEVGLIYNGNVGHTQNTTGTSYGMDKTSRYNGVLIFYTTMWTKASILTGGGQSFDIASSTWKAYH